MLLVSSCCRIIRFSVVPVFFDKVRNVCDKLFYSPFQFFFYCHLATFEIVQKFWNEIAKSRNALSIIRSTFPWFEWAQYPLGSPNNSAHCWNDFWTSGFAFILEVTDEQIRIGRLKNSNHDQKLLRLVCSVVRIPNHVVSKNGDIP